MTNFYLSFLFASALAAQPFSAGIKGGIRLTDDLENGSATSESHRYVIGPTATVGLPIGFRVELDALYRRTGYRSSGTDILGGTAASRFVGNSWEFPLLIRHTLWHGIYGAVGYVPRANHSSGHVNAVSVVSLDPFVKSYSEYDVPGRWDITHGLAVAAGIEKRLGPVRLTPEIRYTHWNRPTTRESGARGFSIFSTQDQVDALIGITF